MQPDPVDWQQATEWLGKHANKSILVPGIEPAIPVRWRVHELHWRWCRRERPKTSRAARIRAVDVAEKFVHQGVVGVDHRNSPFLHDIDDHLYISATKSLLVSRR
jgi:hypothetical protein